MMFPLSTFATAAAPAPAGQGLTACNTTNWEEWLILILELLLQDLNCPSLQLPPDVPVAMEVTVDCYKSSGLAPMTLSERLAFLAVLDEAELAAKQAPQGFPDNTLKAFVNAIAAMRQEAMAVP
ncbi:MAG: hypothetical protein KF869_15725 [Phycisphaeraceae bacterium]|nr:hypothetical protein [Phycisphaeraceae bacterium]